jgi:hypothetical protein
MADTTESPVAAPARDEVTTEGAETVAPAPADGASEAVTTTTAVNGDTEVSAASNDSK